MSSSDREGIVTQLYIFKGARAQRQEGALPRVVSQSEEAAYAFQSKRQGQHVLAGLRGGSDLRLLPPMRQQLADGADRLGRQALHDVLQVGMRLVPIELGRVDQAHDGSGPLARPQ